MLKDDERVILYLDVISKTKSRVLKGGIKPLPAIELYKLIKKIYSSGMAYRKNKSETEIIYLSDISFNSSTSAVTLLINRSDKRASDPAFSNPEVKSRRVVNKKIGEGQDNSAHIVWSTNPNSPSNKNSYLFLLESSPGLTTAKICVFLNFLLLEAAKSDRKKFEILHPDGSIDSKGIPKKAFYYPNIELHGHLCQDFKEELDNGKLEDIEIYTESNHKMPWDTNGYTEEKKKSVHISIAKNKVAPKNWPIIKEIFKEADNNNYECARVIFSSEQEMGRSVKLYTDTLSIVNDFKFVKKAKIEDFSEPLLSSYDKIHKQIKNKMINLL